MNSLKTSQISKFYKLSLFERQRIIEDWLNDSNALEILRSGGLDSEQANHMIENVVGLFNMPFGIATNFLINNKDYLIPMVIEEPSVVAAASNAAKMFRSGGGFITSSDDPIMIGQIQLLDIEDMPTTIQKIDENRKYLIGKANESAGSILQRGGGVRNLEVRVIESDDIAPMLVLHLLYDTRDAMGANAVNTAVEYIASDVERITGGRVNLRILSNLTDKRKARCSGIVPKEMLRREGFDGEAVVDAIVEAGLFASIDPYRATTHNKGVMNGIDPVVIATGNDWRAIEAGAHAFAARSGSYTSMTRWTKTANGDLEGYIELPMALGIVGGATKVHPLAQLSLAILGVESAQELAEVVVTVGLAQNLGALRALATEGIQKGHMRMHARQLAVAAGASAEQVVTVANQMIVEGNIRLERAKQLLKQLQETLDDNE